MISFLEEKIVLSFNDPVKTRLSIGYSFVSFALVKQPGPKLLEVLG